MGNDTRAAAGATAPDMAAWERPLLHSDNGTDALFALSRLAGVDAYQPRNHWRSGASRKRVRKGRRLLFAYLRRELKEHPGESFTYAIPVVIGWMMLMTECPIGPQHQRELIGCIERDPDYRNRHALGPSPEDSRQTERVRSIGQLLVALRRLDTSNYVVDRPRGWWSRIRDRLVTRMPRQLQPFIKTEIRPGAESASTNN
jgi:hypothetical protein